MMIMVQMIVSSKLIHHVDRSAIKSDASPVEVINYHYYKHFLPLCVASG